MLLSLPVPAMGLPLTGQVLAWDGGKYEPSTISAATLGLGTMATQNANAVAITGGTITGVPLGSGTTLPWSSIIDSGASITIAHAAYTTNMTWNTATTGNQLVFSSSSLSSGVLCTVNVTGTAAVSNTQQAFRVTNSGANANASQKTFGAQILNTRTGTTSTNVALQLSTTGATNNYALIIAAGRIGSTTQAPDAFFEDSNASAASLPVWWLSGTVFTGGTATTNKPHFLIQPTATTSNAWSTGGTLIGGNAVSGFAGMLTDLQVSAVSKFSVDASGNAIAAGTLAVTGIVTATGGLKVAGISALGSATTLANVLVSLPSGAAFNTGTGVVGIRQAWSGLATATGQVYGCYNFVGTGAGCAEAHQYVADAVNPTIVGTLVRHVGFTCIRGTPATNNYGFAVTTTPTSMTAGNWAFYNDTTDASYLGGNLTVVGTAGIISTAAFATNVGFSAVNTAASGSGTGAIIQVAEDDGAACASGDRLGGLTIAGARDAAHVIANSIGIVGFAAEAWSGTACGADLALQITAIGATARTERMRITALGNTILGTQAALATNATDGFAYVPSCAGTPTGVPTAYTGMVPIVVDTTANKLYFYSTGAWRDAGP